MQRQSCRRKLKFLKNDISDPRGAIPMTKMNACDVSHGDQLGDPNLHSKSQFLLCDFSVQKDRKLPKITIFARPKQWSIQVSMSKTEFFQIKAVMCLKTIQKNVCFLKELCNDLLFWTL